jgi:hypothetical protein
LNLSLSDSGDSVASAAYFEARAWDLANTS